MTFRCNKLRKDSSNKGLLKSNDKFDIYGLKYTSYPAEDRFVKTFTAEQYSSALSNRRLMGSSLALYIHVPFCESLCLYCARNKVITKQHERAHEYLQYLQKEIDLHIAKMGKCQPVNQLYLGGGSPTFFSDNELTELIRKIQDNFSLVSEGEFSIEIDPRTVDTKRLRHLAGLGFNRLSFGVQDFDPDVQKAVNREQPVQGVYNLIEDARVIGFKSINIDLIYGLPNQTSHSFARTLNAVNSLIKPDRISLSVYAHLPQQFKSQRFIRAEDLPSSSDKMRMLSDAINTFQNAGYIYIGMDHFALPNDPLAIAMRQGRLHRNLQGYTTQPEGDLIGLGISSIGHIGTNYSQNTKNLNQYYDALDQGFFPTERGLALSHDDALRRAVIMALMCQGGLQYEPIETSYLIDFKTYFLHELELLQSVVSDGLLVINEESMSVTDKGWSFVRDIASVFDRFLQTDKNRSS